MSRNNIPLQEQNPETEAEDIAYLEELIKEIQIENRKAGREKTREEILEEITGAAQENIQLEDQIVEEIAEKYGFTEENESFSVEDFDKKGWSYHKIYTFETKADNKKTVIHVKENANLKKVEAHEFHQIFISKILEELGYGPKTDLIIAKPYLFTISEDIISAKRKDHGADAGGRTFDNLEQLKKGHNTLNEAIKNPESLHHLAAVDIIANLLRFNASSEDLSIRITPGSSPAAVSAIQADKLRPMIINFYPSLTDNNINEVVQEIFGNKPESKVLLDSIDYKLGEHSKQIATEILDRFVNGKKDQAETLQKPNFLQAVENAYAYATKFKQEISEKVQDQQEQFDDAIESVKEYKEEIKERFKTFEKELRKIIENKGSSARTTGRI